MKKSKLHQQADGSYDEGLVDAAVVVIVIV